MNPEHDFSDSGYCVECAEHLTTDKPCVPTTAEPEETEAL